MTNRVQELLGVEFPVVQAPMTYIARAELAAAVSEGGGLGMIETRMLASEEALVHANFKDAIVAADDAGTVLLDVPGNPTMRVLRTGLAARISEHTHDAKLLGRITDLYFAGDLEASVANTGQVSSRITDLRPVADIVRRTWCDIEAALDVARERLG